MDENYKFFGLKIEKEENHNDNKNNSNFELDIIKI
jgi:hypothetical protein